MKEFLDLIDLASEEYLRMIRAHAREDRAGLVEATRSLRETLAEIVAGLHRPSS